MKRKNLSFLVSCLTVSLLLAACGGQASDSSKGTSSSSSVPTTSESSSSTSVAPVPVIVSSVTLKGLASAYTLGYNIDWSGVSLEVKYSNDTTETITDIEYDIEAPTKPNTKAIIDTDGLKEEGATNVVKDYNLSATLKIEEYSSSHDLGTISIQDYSEENSKLISFSEPQFVTDYKLAISSEGKSEEAVFYNTEELFTVGHLNPFKVMPSIVVRPNDSGQLVTTKNYKKVVNIYHRLDDGTKGELLDSSLYTIDNEGVDFKEGAIGNDLIIEVKPQTFSKDITGADIEPFTFDFKVENGLNIYKTSDLSAINLTHLTPNDFHTQWWNRHSDNISPTDQNCIDFFYDEATNTYGFADQGAIWLDYIRDNEIFTEEEIEAYTDSQGYFFMNNLKLDESCLPDEYIISENEATKQSGSTYAAGSIRDGLIIYNLMLNVPKTVNGNYFTLDARDLKVSKSSELEHKIYTREANTIQIGRGAIFEFQGIANDWQSYHDQVLNPLIKEGIIKNINAVGNTTDKKTGEEIDEMMNVTGIRLAQSGYTGATFENIIAKQFVFGVGANIALGQGNDNVPPFISTTIKDCKFYDCANSGLYTFQTGGIKVTHTEMKRFGGSVFTQLGNYPSGTGLEPFVMSNLFIDPDCVMENYVTGQEAYFKTLGDAAAMLVAQLHIFDQVMSTPVSLPYPGGVNTSITDDEGRFNMLGLTMGGDGIMARLPYYAKLDLTVGIDHLVMNPFDDSQLENILYANFGAPVCKTEKGEIFVIIPPEQALPAGIYAYEPDESKQIAPGVPLTPFPSELTGKYMGMFLPVPGSAGPMLVTFGIPPKAAE